MSKSLLLSLIATSLATFTLEWEDDFSNTNNWDISVETGAQTGNNEWEYYTNRQNNVFIQNISGDNALILKAQREDYNGYHVTSGKVISKQSFGPGHFFNIRAKVPKGRAIWPAIWLLPDHARSKYGSWAACGEIDIMETLCDRESAYATLHFGGTWPNNKQYPPDNDYHVSIDWSQPHNFGVHWETNKMTFYYDADVVNGEIQGKVVKEITSDHWYADSDGHYFPSPAPFDVPFKIILNVAVGGNWPCNSCCQGGPDGAALPAEMQVHFVKVYKSEGDIEFVQGQ